MSAPKDDDTHEAGGTKAGATVDAADARERFDLGGIGGALGGLARRVRDAVTDLSESFSLPEVVRDALVEADALRRAEDFDGAIERLRTTLLDHPGQAALWSAWAVVRAHQALVAPTTPDAALSAGLAALESQPAGAFLWMAATLGDDPAKVKDALRRARRRLEDESPPTAAAIDALCAVVEADAEGRAGAVDRQRRSLEIARARASDAGGRRLWACLRRSAVDAWLAAHRPERARRWLAVGTGGDPEAIDRGLMARVDAASGQTDLAWADIGEREDVRLEDRVRVGLMAGEDVRALASKLDTPRIRALAELASALPGDDVDAQLDLLETNAEDQQRALRLQAAREAAFWALRFGAFDRPALRRLAGELHSEAPELWVWARRAELETNATPDPAAWTGDDAARLRPITDVTGPHGPDEVSALRDDDLRGRTLAAHRRLAVARRLARSGHLSLARSELLEALVDDPDTVGAGAMLTELALGSRAHTLDEILAGATAVLAEVPTAVGADGGAGLSGLAAAPAALQTVVAARERLARPLTIAIMGEFSAGKSTFVNALLGEVLAPMGVLPTTNTINVFRRGANARARVHYRDGKIGTVEAAEVREFLGGLDDTASAAIRYVEIERGPGNLGDATVVDTPGLNALDPYHERVAREFVDEADAVVWIFSATRGAVASERKVLDELRADGRRVLGVLNKADTLEGGDADELVSYLRNHVGDVLVDVLPLSATSALAAGGDDPGLLAVTGALERAFLSRARELKAEIAQRRLLDALAHAIAGLSAAADALEAPLSSGAWDPAGSLADLGDTVHAQVLGHPEGLARELLAIGVVEIGKGGASPEIGPQDLEYVEALVNELLLDALRAAIRSGDPDVVSVVDAKMRPWCRGYVTAWARRDGPRALLDHAAAAARDGERSLRAAIESELRLFADDWRSHAWTLRHSVSVESERARRARTARSRAAAVQLRRATVPALRGLKEALELLGSTSAPA